MTELEYLRDQAARAERLAKGVVDTLTVERLHAYATECRQKIEALSNGKGEHQAA
jgi:hypothetical protein